MLQYNGADDAQALPLQPETAAPPALSDLLRGLALPQGRLVPFGTVWYLTPPETPALAGLRVLRAGLCLGEMKKNRFEPAHALALYLREAPSMADFPADGTEIAAYLRGAPLAGDLQGWTLLTASGLSIGWVKGSGGTLKNHYPKGLRRVT